MMPKAAFIEEMNDDDGDTNFELISRVCVFFARDNQTQGSIMSCNVTGPPQTQGLVIDRNVARLPDEQGLSRAKSSKKKQLDEWLHCHKYGGLNVIWCKYVLDKPCVDLIECLGILGGYFCINIFVCKPHLPLLAVYCYLKTNCPDDTHDHLRMMWTHVSLIVI